MTSGNVTVGVFEAKVSPYISKCWCAAGVLLCLGDGLSVVGRGGRRGREVCGGRECAAHQYGIE